VAGSASEASAGGDSAWLPLHFRREHATAGAALLAAQRARRLGISHVLVMERDIAYDPSDLERIVSMAARFPEAVIVGKRCLRGAPESRSSKFRRHLSNFWLGLQTHQLLSDSTCSLRVYPVHVLENLKFLRFGAFFDTEVLVKAAWGDVPLKEVALMGYYPPARHRAGVLTGLLAFFSLILLNIHYSFRAITPIPHKKIVTIPDTGERVSMLHPLRSMKTLLSENSSPARLALAGGLGVFLGALPTIGFHTLSILFSAQLFRLNKVAAIGASQLCMPPLVPALCIEAGYYMRHGEFLTRISLETLGYQAVQRLWEWGIGAIALAPLLSALVGGFIYVLAVCVRRRI